MPRINWPTIDVTFGHGCFVSARWKCHHIFTGPATSGGVHDTMCVSLNLLGPPCNPHQLQLQPSESRCWPVALFCIFFPISASSSLFFFFCCWLVRHTYATSGHRGLCYKYFTVMEDFRLSISLTKINLNRYAAAGERGCHSQQQRVPCRPLATLAAAWTAVRSS